MSSDNEQNAPQIQLKRIYIRDLSFQAPRGIEALSRTAAPEINMQLNNQARKFDDDQYEVVLTITIKAKERESDELFYEVEVKQAGLFVLKQFPDQELESVLNAYCPSVLFPYARESIAATVQRGGFPQLLLNPINFEAVYHQHLEQVKQAEQESSSAGPAH